MAFDREILTEELRLRLPTIGSFTIPPLGSIAINNMSRSPVDSDVATRERDERAAPLLVPKGRSALERHARSGFEPSQIQSLTSRYSDTVQNDLRA